MMLHACFPLAAAGEESFPWQQLRGVTTSTAIDLKVMQELADTGASLIRVSPYGGSVMNDDGTINMDIIHRYDAILKNAKRTGLKVIIDPHHFPGCKDLYTSRPADPFWKDYKYHAMAIQTWEFLAERYKNEGNVIAGYDLFNEPGTPDIAAQSGPASWPELAGQLAAAVRKHDTRHTIIIAAHGGLRDGQWVPRHQGFAYLTPPRDITNIAFEDHIYNPQEYAEKGLGTYPGIFRTQGKPVYWNKTKLRETLRPILDFQHKYNVPIYIGEFAPNITVSDGGVVYLRDIVSLFEEYHWAWTFHSYRTARIYDVSKAPALLAVLKEYWQRNRLAQP